MVQFVRACNQPEVSNTNIYNKLLYHINADPYSLTMNDIVSAEGISAQDKTKAIEELQRNQEITSRPNYKAARELFDIDFKQQYGDDLSVDPSEEKAKWLRVFHSCIIDKKMEPLDAVEKIRKDYGVQENPPPAPSQEGNIINSSREGNEQSPAGGNERSPLPGGVGVGSSKTPETRGEQSRTIDPSDTSLLVSVNQ